MAGWRSLNTKASRVCQVRKKEEEEEEAAAVAAAVAVRPARPVAAEP